MAKCKHFRAFRHCFGGHNASRVQELKSVLELSGWQNASISKHLAIVSVAIDPRACGHSYTSSASTGNQLYKQRKHRQPVIQAAQAQATSYTRSASTGNASTGNQLYRQRKHRQPVIHVVACAWVLDCLYNWLPVLWLRV